MKRKVYSERLEVFVKVVWYRDVAYGARRNAVFALRIALCRVQECFSQ